MVLLNKVAVLAGCMAVAGAGVGPALAQSAGDQARPHHAYYGDDARYRRAAGEAQPAPVRDGASQGTTRPHHAVN